MPCVRPIPGLLLFAIPSLALAADWPQWRGPNRTGVSRETGLLSAWPKEGPRLLWTIKDAGEGYSGPAISRGFLYTMGNRGEEEFVLCYDLADGRQRWGVKNGKAYHNGYGDGPRCTPTIDGDRLFALGANGDLCCLACQDGKEIWRLNILAEFRGNNIGWGISESPLVEGDMLLVTPGGEKGTVVALDKRTGKTIWTGKDPDISGREAAGYASLIAFTAHGVRQVATFTSRGGVAFRAQDGKFLWRYDRPANGTANIASPIYHDGQVFFTSDYGTGGGLVRLTPEGAEEVYFTKAMRNHHGGVVLVDGFLYGASGAVLTCMDFATGKVAWTHRSVGKGSLCVANGHLYYLSEDGTAALVEATPAGYREKGQFPLPSRSDQSSWTHPVVAGGRLYLRDQESIYCYDVKGN